MKQPYYLRIEAEQFLDEAYPPEGVVQAPFYHFESRSCVYRWGILAVGAGIHTPVELGDWIMDLGGLKVCWKPEMFEKYCVEVADDEKGSGAGG